MKISKEVKDFCDKTDPGLDAVAIWMEEEEARLGRELTDEEVAKKVHEGLTAAGYPVDPNGKIKL